MARTLTSQEVKERHERDMPEGIGVLYHALFNEVSYLHVKWKQYRELYGTSSERLKILNENCRIFFGIIERVLRHDVLLSVAKLTDEWKVGRGQNSPESASLKRLIREVRDQGEDDLYRELSNEMKELAVLA